MVRSNAPLSEVCRVITPLHWAVWETELVSAGCLSSFSTVPSGIRFGFRIGVTSPVSITYIPPNHKSASVTPSAVDSHVRTELLARRYSGPFSPATLESLIGPFRCSPLGVVPKPIPGEFRIIQDLSFPRDHHSITSVNSEIDSDDFPCEWGTFAECALLLLSAPPGSQASVNDVEKAFRIIPVHPLDQPHVVVMWRGSVYPDHCTAFGGASSPGIFGHVADAAIRIFKHHGAQDVIKWVDDFLFWRYPLPDGSGFPYDESLIFSVADRLGLPWSKSKHTPFATHFLYNGFSWDIPAQSVQIPLAKKQKYLLRFGSWVPGATVCLVDVERLIGTLNHCCLAVPFGRSHLPSFYRLSSRLHRSSSKFVRVPIPPAVLEDVAWWCDQLRLDFCGSTLYIPPRAPNLRVFVDASTSWGIGLVVNGGWSAWYLQGDWRSEGRDIGWAEMVAVELAVRFLAAQGLRNTRVTIHSDNQGVIGALHSGFSRSTQQNRVLQRIVSLFVTTGIWVDTTYVRSAENLADAPSRGVFHSPDILHKLPCNVPLPFALKPFVRLA